MRNIIFSTFILNTIFITAYSQTKKEKIEVFKFQLDSLNLVIKSKMIDINNKDTMIWDLENQIKILYTTIDKRKLEENILKDSNFKKDLEIQKKNDEIIGLHQVISELRDSIKNTSQKIDTIVWDIPDLTWDQMEFNLKLFLPVSKFDNPTGNLLISHDQKIKISYDYNNTHWSDQEEGNPLFYKEEDAINYYSKDLHDIELTYNEGFILRGKNAANQLTMIKGLYTDFASMQGRDEGEPMWLWSNTLIIKATANQKDKEEFNYISELLINNFTTKSIIINY